MLASAFYVSLKDLTMYFIISYVIFQPYTQGTLIIKITIYSFIMVRAYIYPVYLAISNIANIEKCSILTALL